MNPTTPVSTNTGKRGVVVFSVPLAHFFARLSRRERPYNALLRQMTLQHWEIAHSGWVAVGGTPDDLGHCVCLTKGEPYLLVVVYPVWGCCPHDVRQDLSCSKCQRYPEAYRWWAMRPAAEVIEVLKE